MFQIHNVAHHPKTRLVRAAAPVHARHKQYILKTQRRLIPNRPIAVTEDELTENLEELKALEARGIIECRLASGELVDLKTFTVTGSLPDTSKPRFRQDSAQNDPPRGKSAVFTSDTTEEIAVKEGEHAGGGMTEEAMAEAALEQGLPPLPEELQHLEDEPKQASAPVPEGNAFGGPSPEGVDEDEPEQEHKEQPKAKKRPRR
jgi:hypothetical protein